MDEKQFLTAIEKILDSKLEPIKSDITAMKADISGMKTDITSLDQRLIKMEVMQENIVEKKINLLIEGQQTILDTLAPKSRVDDLEEEVKFLKSVVRQVCEDMQELKRAQ